VSPLELALLAQALIFLIVAGAFLASGQASLFHPLTFYLGFHGLVFVIRPAMVHFLNFNSLWRYMQVVPTDAEFIRTLAVTSVALVAFSIPCLWTGWCRTEFITARPEPFSVPQWRALVLTTLLLGPIIAYSIRTTLGGGLQGEHIGGVFIMEGASGYTVEAQNMAGALICAWMVVTRFNRWALLPLIIYVAYRSYAGWNRWTFVLLFLALSATYAWQRRGKWLPLWTVVLAIPLLLLFQTLGKNRDYFRMLLAGESLQESVQPMTRAEQLQLKYDTQEFANFDFLCYVVKMVPERTGTFTYGTQYLQLFTEPIPRKLWPGKPIGAPVGFFNLNNYGNFLGLTPSLPGDGWMSGGWVGLVITLSLVGGLLGLAHRWFWRHVQNNFAVLFYLVGIAMLPQWYRDGGISISKFFFWNFAPLLVWLGLTWICGPRRIPAYSYWLPPGLGIRAIQVTGATPPRPHP
jgi:hypothetical protein